MESMLHKYRWLYNATCHRPNRDTIINLISGVRMLCLNGKYDDLSAIMSLKLNGFDLEIVYHLLKTSNLEIDNISNWKSTFELFKNQFINSGFDITEFGRVM